MLHEPFFTDTVMIQTGFQWKQFICSQLCRLYTTSSSIIWTPLKHKHYYGSVFLVPILWKYSGYTFYFSFDHFKDGVLTPCKVIWILEFRNFCFWSLQSGKVLPVESGNMAFGIHNSTQGTLKPTNNGIWNSSANDRESRIQNPESCTWNLEFSMEFRIQSCLWLPYIHAGWQSCQLLLVPGYPLCECLLIPLFRWNSFEGFEGP